MPATQLTTKAVRKPWGRRDLPAAFAAMGGGDEPVGEIWFEAPGRPGEAELLVKYLFTSDRLSVQVHPDDAAARERGFARGKDEAWVVLDAAADATIAIGPRAPTDRAALRAAALDGGIVDLLDWKRVRAGDSFYTPAGTVHAIGAGLTLVEVQQNVDLTYRLYDYGSDRPLHLDDGIAVSRTDPYAPPSAPRDLVSGRVVLADGPAFVLERWTGPLATPLDAGGRRLWLVPLAGDNRIDGQPLSPGSAWLVEGGAALTLAADADLLVAYVGAGVIAALWPDA